MHTRFISKLYDFIKHNILNIDDQICLSVKFANTFSSNTKRTVHHQQLINEISYCIYAHMHTYRMLTCLL